MSSCPENVAVAVLQLKITHLQTWKLILYIFRDREGISTNCNTASLQRRIRLPSAELSPDGKAKEWPLYDLKDKQVMVFDEFNIHPEKESQRKIVDWERTYFLTKCYGFWSVVKQSIKTRHGSRRIYPSWAVS